MSPSFIVACMLDLLMGIPNPYCEKGPPDDEIDKKEEDDK